MLRIKDLIRMADARIKDAEALFRARQYDGAVYIVGYAIEFTLKARIANGLLGGRKFPETNQEFTDLASLKSHDLSKLLRLSGRDNIVNTTLQAKWSFVLGQWATEVRYRKIGSADRKAARAMIDTVKDILTII